MGCYWETVVGGLGVGHERAASLGPIQATQPPGDVAEAVVFCLTRAPSVDIPLLQIQPCDDLCSGLIMASLPFFGLA